MMRLRHSLAAALAVLATGLPAAAAVPGAGQSTDAQDAATQADPPPAQRVTASVTTRTERVARSVVQDGRNLVIDSRTITVEVSSLKGLRDRAGVRVNWSGAHPTGGIVSDPNSATAATQQEYPMVLMQCRGVDSTKVAPGRRLTPRTCWTQTSSERFTSDYNTALPPWRMDRYAAPADRKAIVNRPKKMTPQCASVGMAEHWLPFVSAKGAVYGSGPNGCGGTAPEAVPFSSNLALPGNTTYGATAKNGRGAATFNVRTSSSNASLGCSQSVQCALVVVPIIGISCDADGRGLPKGESYTADEIAAAARACQAKGTYAPGEPFNPSRQADQAVAGSLWWSASNWRNRMVFPMQFAPSSSVCDITAGSEGVSVFGSELMVQATEQWSPKFCLDRSLTPVNHVQTGEPQARSLLKTGSIDAALVSRPQDGGYPRPTVHAPVAVTGFAVTFQVDGRDGRPLTSLKLTPRLLAKLLTESYPAVPAVRDSYPALAKNPLNITDDPEFQALNPQARTAVSTASASTILSLSSDSDVMYALTSYIESDPEARAWLGGKPDPWGMVVNPNYKKISLPVQVWPTLDTFQPTGLYRPGVNDCLAQNPVPYLPLVAAAMTRLSTISLAMQFAIAQSQIVCYLPSPIPGNTEGAKLVALGRQTPGFRFMLGVTSLADAQRYAIPQASLRTSRGASDARVGAPATATFVAPSDVSLRRATTLLRPDRATTNWELDYKSFGTARGAGAYPGTLLVYADIPTQGLPTSAAQAYATWLRYVVTSGQRRGDGVGQLPAGYLPLTKGDGLAALRDYSLRAAAAVAKQSGQVPPLTATKPSSGGGRPPTTPGGSGSGPSSDPGTPPQAAGRNATDGPGPPTKDGAGSSPVAAPLGRTAADFGGMAGVVLPVVLLLALAAGAAASATLLRARLRGSR